MAGVAPLLVGLDSTLTESPKNTNISQLPTSLESTLVELLASPLYAGNLSLIFPLFVYLKRVVNWNLFIFLAEEVSQLIHKSKVCSFTEACINV